MVGSWLDELPPSRFGGIDRFHAKPVFWAYGAVVGGAVQLQYSFRAMALLPTDNRRDL